MLSSFGPRATARGTDTAAPIRTACGSGRQRHLADDLLILRQINPGFTFKKIVQPRSRDYDRTGVFWSGFYLTYIGANLFSGINRNILLQQVIPLSAAISTTSGWVFNKPEEATQRAVRRSDKTVRAAALEHELEKWNLLLKYSMRWDQNLIKYLNFDMVSQLTKNHNFSIAASNSLHFIYYGTKVLQNALRLRKITKKIFWTSLKIRKMQKRMS